ncbi:MULTISPECIES: ATP-binding protein [Ensifer]|jgi:DNA replication protein DnaC|uniref:ATP-binding protein n=1 Tax=Ensifer TaxID=106591 RepID=UPI000AD74480|nr:MULTISPECIES: ATP-binding protein [Ensifer]
MARWWLPPLGGPGSGVDVRPRAVRTDRRLTNRLATAKLCFANASNEDIDFGSHPGLDRRNVLSLAQGAWLKANENLILTGQTGTGKRWIACAFAQQAARLNDSVQPTLFEDLALARLDGRFPRLVDKLARVHLLVLDDWRTHTLNDRQRLDLLELFEERYRRNRPDHGSASRGPARNDRRGHSG